MNDATQDRSDHAGRSRLEWEQRALSKFRNFYIASHYGWDDPRAWEAQAAYDADFVLSRVGQGEPGVFGGRRAGDVDLLEIGCGSGRLARVFAPRFRSYTGIDHAPSMIEAAKAVVAPNARFFVSDGTSLPREAGDRTYGVAIAQAVFIHCAADTCLKLATAVCGSLAPGGEFRGQFRAQVSEPITRSTTTADAPTRPALLDEVERRLPEAEAFRLIDGTAYTGDAFRAEEVFQLLRAAGFAHVDLFRLEPEVHWFVARAP